MSSKFSLYQFIKKYLAKDIVHDHPIHQLPQTSTQNTNLMAVFNLQTNQFHGAFYNTISNIDANQTFKSLNEMIENITYWHCHGRSINCVLPIHASLLINESHLEEIEKILITSKLPIGFIIFGIIQLDQCPIEPLELALMRLRRLGIYLEIINFSGSHIDLYWLSKNIFQGIHLEISLIREFQINSSLLEKHINIFRNNKVNKFHKYCGGITLVHDFVFVKKIGIDFCYGALMMPPVSKHQILKIKESHFANASSAPTPSLNLYDGDHR